MIVTIFLYIIAISISACPIFRIRKKTNNHIFFTQNQMKLKKREISIKILLLKVKEIKNNFLENFIFKITSEREL